MLCIGVLDAKNGGRRPPAPPPFTGRHGAQPMASPKRIVGRRRAAQLRRQYASQIIEVIELRVKTLGFEHAEKVGAKILELYEKGEFDVATLFFSRFRSVVAQIPTALQIIPPVFPEKAANG